MKICQDKLKIVLGTILLIGSGFLGSFLKKIIEEAANAQIWVNLVTTGLGLLGLFFLF